MAPAARKARRNDRKGPPKRVAPFFCHTGGALHPPCGAARWVLRVGRYYERSALLLSVRLLKYLFPEQGLLIRLSFVLGSVCR
jgi:hypothetical protein